MSNDERWSSEGSCDTVTISCNARRAATLNVNYRCKWNRFLFHPVVLQCRCESFFFFFFLFLFFSIGPGRFIVKGLWAQVGEDGSDLCRDCCSDQVTWRDCEMQKKSVPTWSPSCLGWLFILGLTVKPNCHFIGIISYCQCYQLMCCLSLNVANVMRLLKCLKCILTSYIFGFVIFYFEINRSSSFSLRVLEHTVVGWIWWESRGSWVVNLKPVLPWNVSVQGSVSSWFSRCLIQTSQRDFIIILSYFYFRYFHKGKHRLPVPTSKILKLCLYLFIRNYLPSVGGFKQTALMFSSWHDTTYLPGCNLYCSLG